MAENKILNPKGTHLLTKRHGESWLNAMGLDEMTSQTIPLDVPLDEHAHLTQKGIEQAIITADEVARRLQSISGLSIEIDVSPMDRAMETAEILKQRINALRDDPNRVNAVTVVPEFRENKLGLTEPHYVLQYPDELGPLFDRYWDARRSDPAAKMTRVPVERLTPRAKAIAAALGLTDIADIKGESYEQVNERVREGFERLRASFEQPGRTSIIVAHFGVLFNVRKLVLREILPPEALNDPAYDQANCSVTTYQFHPEEGWQLQAWAEDLAHVKDNQ